MFWLLLAIVLVLNWRLNRFRLGAITLFMGIYIAGFHIGIPFIPQGAFTERELTQLLWLSSLFLISVLCGALLVDRTRNFNSLVILLYSTFIRFPCALTYSQRLKLGIVTFYSFVLGAYYFRYGIPYLADNPNVLRFKASAGAAPFMFMLTFLAPMYALVLTSWNSRLARFGALLGSFLIGLATAFRSGPARMLLAYIVSKFAWKRIPVALGLAFMLLLFVLFFVMTMLKYEHLDMSTIFSAVLRRLFYINIYNSVFVLNQFSSFNDFKWGGVLWMDLANYIPNGLETFGVWVNQQLYSYENVSANPSFTVFWADFGWGYLAPSFLLGAFLQLFDKIGKKILLNQNEKIIWAFLVVVLAFTSTNPYAKNLYYTMPMLFYLFVTKRFIFSRP